MCSQKYTIDDWRAVRSELRLGKTIRKVASITGVNRNAVWRWSKVDEPPEGMWLHMEASSPSMPMAPKASHKARLTYEQRVLIYCMWLNDARQEEIAQAVGCHRTTIGRELRRIEGGYDPRAAHAQAFERSRRPKGFKLDDNQELRSYVVNSLMLHWSPEQISNYIEREFPDREDMRISHETIYQALYLQGKGALRHELGVQLSLRSKRKGRRPQSKLPAKGRPWVEGKNISLRPPEAEDRAIPGHWEGDLVIGSDRSSCLITLIERRSRFLLMSRLCVHDADTVEQRLEKMVATLPGELAKTLAWDQGCEMAETEKFELATGFTVYFCDPHSPWQRPTNENVNGLIREFFPKGTNFTEVTDEEVERAQWLLNNRPRKVLDLKPPSNVMQEVLSEGAMIA